MPDQVRHDDGECSRAWVAALAGWRGAAAAVAGEEGRLAGASFEAAEAGQGVYDGLCAAAEGALGRLWAAPAPDVGALAVKLELFARADGASMDAGEAALKAMAGDARRLAGEG
jgi:hypothetical protein